MKPYTTEQKLADLAVLAHGDGGYAGVPVDALSLAAADIAVDPEVTMSGGPDSTKAARVFGALMAPHYAKLAWDAVAGSLNYAEARRASREASRAAAVARANGTTPEDYAAASPRERRLMDIEYMYS